MEAVELFSVPGTNIYVNFYLLQNLILWPGMQPSTFITFIRGQGPTPLVPILAARCTDVCINASFEQIVWTKNIRVQRKRW